MSLHYLYTMLLHYTACSRRDKNLELTKRRHQGAALQRGWALPDASLLYKGEIGDKAER